MQGVEELARRYSDTGKQPANRVDKGAARKSRDTYKYQLKVGNKVVYRGITNDLERREKDHQVNWPGAYIEQVGRLTTRSGALKWERMASAKEGSPRSGWHVRSAAKYGIDLHRDALRELERH